MQIMPTIQYQNLAFFLFTDHISVQLLPVFHTFAVYT